MSKELQYRERVEIELDRMLNTLRYDVRHGCIATSIRIVCRKARLKKMDRLARCFRMASGIKSLDSKAQ